jgi:hypothetical protein
MQTVDKVEEDNELAAAPSTLLEGTTLVRISLIF